MDAIVKAVIVIIVALLARTLYNDYTKTDAQYEREKHVDLVSEYLVSRDNESAKVTGRPILWIHVDHGYNARNWSSFYSRSNAKLNQPYLFITMKSIVDKCMDSFDVCIVDDDSFRSLVPGWGFNISSTPEPAKTMYRRLGLSVVLHEYGGLLVPSSFLCLHDLGRLYEACDHRNVLSVETTNRSGVPGSPTFCPSFEFMGCKKGSETMEKYIAYQTNMCKNSFTSEPQFTNTLGAWLANNVASGDVIVVDGKRVGTRKSNDRPVELSELLGINTIDFEIKNMIGIYLPQKEILNNISHGWFTRMSTDQVLDSNLAIAQYMLCSY